MGRILSIDYGKKRTGVAVSDTLQLIANGLTTVDTPRLFAFVKDYLAKEPVDTIVVGKPKQMDNTASENMVRITPFFNRLRKAFPQVEVVYYDERFTSVLAHKAMITGGMKKSERRNNKGVVDEISAVIILEDYMESRRMQQERL